MLRPWERRDIELRDKHVIDSPTAKGWIKVELQTRGYIWDNLKMGLRVMQTVCTVDGKVWLHTSVSRPKKWKMPSYEDISRVKKAFVGADRMAIQLFVPEDQHVNLQNVLHLYTPIDDPEFKIPDFRIEVSPGVWDLQ